MMALMWLVFTGIVATGQAQFPQPEHLEQYMGYEKTIVFLDRLLIKTIPDNAFRNYSNITVRITK